MGFFTGASDALQELLVEQEQRRRQQMLDQIAADDRASRNSDRVESRRIQQEQLDLTKQRYKAADDEKAKKDAAAQAEVESGNTRDQLQAAMQGSFNQAGTGDPNGAKATRDALRVAMISGGAKPTEIAQEPVAPKPVARSLHSVPGVGLVSVDPATGDTKVLVASVKNSVSKPGAPQIFKDTEGNLHAIRFGPDGKPEEITLPAGLTGRAGVAKAAPKTPAEIEAEAAARARGAATGKKEAGGSSSNFFGNLYDKVYGSSKPAVPVPVAAPAAGPVVAPPKLGDVKTFPNGTKGVFDGTGWVRQ